MYVQISIMIRGIVMAFLKLLLNSGLIFHTVTATFGGHIEEMYSSRIHYHLPDHIQPLHYEINIIFHTESSTFYGESNITLKVIHNTNTLSLHSEFLDIENNSTTLSHKKSKKIYVPSNYSCVLPKICSFYFDDEIPQGYYFLKLNFFGEIFGRENSDGIFKITYITNQRNRKMFAAGDFQSTNGAQLIFPCWDELTFIATFTISVKHPKNYIAISNWPIKSTENVEADMIWTHFHKTLPMPTYLVAIMVSRLINFTSNHKDMNIWCKDWQTALQLSFAQNIAEAIAKYLEKVYFRDMNPKIEITKIDHVAIPGHLHIRNEGLTNWGVIFYSEAAVIYDEESNSISRMMEVAFLVSRKIAHQWFGNAVTPSSWSHIWLNEGIASFLGLYAADKILPNFRMMDLFVVWTRYKSLNLETNVNMPPIAQVGLPFEIKPFSHFRSTKASAVLRMLNHLLTDEVFRKGIKNYMEDYMFSMASPNDLWEAMGTAQDEVDYEYKFSITRLMETWTTQSHYPVLKMARSYRSGRTLIWQDMRNASEKNVWLIPVTYATQTNPNFIVTWSNQEWLSSWNRFILLPSIDRNDWIIINLQQLGYYRVMYDRENWKKIAKYLNSDEYSKIHVLNRAQIIDDAYHFLMEKQLDYYIFVELTKYLSHDTDYVAWYPMFKIFENMLNIFSHPEATFIKTHMRNIVSDLLKKMGYDDKPHEDILIKSLRQEAAEWACTLGDENCRQLAHHKLQDYLANFTEHTDGKASRWKKWIYCGGLMAASDSATWHRVFNLFPDVSDNIILEYLPCVKNPYRICHYLEELQVNRTISYDKYNNIFVSIIAMHANNDEMLAAVFAEFERVRPRTLTFSEIISAIIKYTYSEKQFQMIKDFVKSKESDLIWDVEREIEKHLSQTEDMLNFFKSTAISKSLNYSESINLDDMNIDILIEMLS